MKIIKSITALWLKVFWYQIHFRMILCLNMAFVMDKP